jgi:hypothetical protein
VRYKVITQPRVMRGVTETMAEVATAVVADSIHFHSDGSIAFYKRVGNGQLEVARAFASGHWAEVIPDEG